MTRLECSTLRCFAIISIILHNFSHWMPGAANENEFSFSSDRYQYFWDSIISSDFIIHIFSFWGHLGVPIFVFLTGYGLAQKYDPQKSLKWKNYLINHWKKLFIPLTTGTFVYLLVMYILEGHLVCSVYRIISQCSMCLNFISPMHLLPMPYWYLGMTMQLYVIYLLLVHKRTIKPLLLLTVVSLFFMIGFADHIVLSKFNCIGWIAPFFMGIAYSRHEIESNIRMRMWLCIILISLLLIIICGFNYYSWLFTPIFVVLFSLGMVKFFPTKFQQKTDSIGRNSLFFLIVHPITREFIMPIVPIMGVYISFLLYILTTFVSVYSFLYIHNSIKKSISKGYEDSTNGN